MSDNLEPVSVSEAARILANSRRGRDEDNEPKINNATNGSVENEAYGKAGVEQSQGYREMQMAMPVPKDDGLEALDSAEVREQLLKDREQPIPVERMYLEHGGEHSGRPKPPEETVDARQAAYDLTNARQGELDAIAAAEEVQVQRAIDQLRSDALQPQPPVSPSGTPEQTSEKTNEQQPTDNAQLEGDAVVRALQENPALLNAVQQAFAVEQAKSQQVAAQYAAAVEQNANVAAASLLSNYPELNGLTAAQLPVAIQTIARTNRPRAESMVQHIEASRSLINGVNFAGKCVEPPPSDEKGKPAGGAANRRAELWSNMKKALEAGRFQLPDRDSLQADLVSAGYKYNSSGQLLIESKQDMRKRGVPSPDEADAVALCFSEPDGSPIPRSRDFNRDLRERYQSLYY
jgi:hypothetical protein